MDSHYVASISSSCLKLSGTMLVQAHTPQMIATIRKDATDAVIGREAFF
jgi:hypothetical protein